MQKSHNANLHGIVSLMFFKAAVLLALVVIFVTSFFSGLIYLLLIIVASAAVLIAYCGKCEARNGHCSHLFPGKATRWLPSRRQGPYSLIDIGVTGGALASMIIYPQYWLWQNKAVLLIFWGLSITAVTEILLRVCPACRNRHCMLCKNPVGQLGR